MTVIASLACAMALAAALPAQEPTELPEFGGKYAELTPRQKALVDDLVRRYTERTDTLHEPEEVLSRLAPRCR